MLFSIGVIFLRLCYHVYTRIFILLWQHGFFSASANYRKRKKDKKKKQIKKKNLPKLDCFAAVKTFNNFSRITTTSKVLYIPE